MSAKPRGKYGIDAPWVPWLWVALALVTVACAALCAWWSAGWWTVVLAWYFTACTIVYLIGASLSWNASLRGKFTVWQSLLRRVVVPEPQRILDLGCGRGAVAIMAAVQFPQAKVTGIDLWRSVDQSGNTPGAAARNLALNGVAGRVQLETGDMTHLPFGDDEFSLVTASVSIHNIRTEAGRCLALQEAVRVLAPGGRLIIVDIQKTREYAEELRSLGLTVDGPRPLGWRSWWTGPWIASSLVEATQ